MEIHLYSGALVALKSDLLVVPFFEGLRPLSGLAGEMDWFYGGIFSEMILRNVVTGKSGEAVLLPSSDRLRTPKVILMGWGSWDHQDRTHISVMAKKIYQMAIQLKVRDCAVQLFLFPATLTKGAAPAKGATPPGNTSAIAVITAFLKGLNEVEAMGLLCLTLILRKYEGVKPEKIRGRHRTGKIKGAS